MHRTRVKICGITNPRDAIAAAEAGADAIGVVFHAASKRMVSPQEARKIAAAVPPFVMVVGLFVDETPARILEIARQVGLTAVQLHGRESPQTAAQLAPFPTIKAIGVLRDSLAAELQTWRAAKPAAILLDTAGGGGSGKANDWAAIEAADRSLLPPLIVAGGLNSATVGDVVRLLRPWAVDVSSGVEIAAREKSPELIRRFITAVREADAQLA